MNYRKAEQIVKYVKRHEGVSVYDTNISYHIFKIKDI